MCLNEQTEREKARIRGSIKQKGTCCYRVSESLLGLHNIYLGFLLCLPEPVKIAILVRCENRFSFSQSKMGHGLLAGAEILLLIALSSLEYDPHDVTSDFQMISRTKATGREYRQETA